MGNYSVVFTTQTNLDITSLRNYILEECLSPLTAKQYIEALFVRIKWLEHNADVFAVVPELSVQMGFDIRRLNFGNMAILFSIEDNCVYVHRIISQNMVIY